MNIKLRLLATLLFIPITANSFCFNEVGRKYNINPKLLAAICYTESRFNAHAINDNNRNGSVDYGLCQINSFWLPHLRKFNITKEDLINNPCINVEVSGWILAQNLKQNGDNWTTIGAYNAGFSNSPNKIKARELYISLVKQNLAYLNSLSN
ncbi:lytic transglycosylase domain-containing protein [Photobacterium damselae]|nr:lytic transglycosylase domain-containing protein [Photobacterium damselae]